MEEEGTIENLVTTLRDQIKYVYVFIIAFKQTDNRMTISLRSTISVLREDVRKTVLEQRHPGGHALEPWQGGRAHPYAGEFSELTEKYKNLRIIFELDENIYILRRGRRSRSSSGRPSLTGSCGRSTSWGGTWIGSSWTPTTTAPGTTRGGSSRRRR